MPVPNECKIAQLQFSIISYLTQKKRPKGTLFEKMLLKNLIVFT